MLCLLFVYFLFVGMLQFILSFVVWMFVIFLGQLIDPSFLCFVVICCQSFSEVICCRYQFMSETSSGVVTTRFIALVRAYKNSVYSGISNYIPCTLSCYYLLFVYFLFVGMLQFILVFVVWVFVIVLGQLVNLSFHVLLLFVVSLTMWLFGADISLCQRPLAVLSGTW